MKLLVVIPSYEPAWAFGGTVTATSQLCRALAAQGVDVTVYTTDADGLGGHLDVSLRSPVNLGGVRTFYFYCNIIPQKAFYSKTLKNKLHETVEDFDIVHVSAIWQWIQVDVHKACKNSNTPYIVTAHGSFSPWPWNEAALKKRIYWHLFGKKTIIDATAIHYTAEEERTKSHSTIPMLNRLPSFVVPNGIRLKNTSDIKSARQRLGISPEKFVLLFIGRIHRVKGIHLVLEAMKKLNDDRFRLLIVGNSEDIEYIEKLKALSKDLHEGVIWHEPVNRDKIWEFYVSSDLFVLPSYNENFSLVAAEAMSCGLPVMLSKDVCIWQEIVKDKAGFAVSQDSQEIADVLRKLPESSDTLSEMSQNARRTVEQRYEINKVAMLMTKAYEDVLANTKSPELKWETPHA